MTKTGEVLPSKIWTADRSLAPSAQGINATAKIIETTHSKVDVGRVLNMQAFKLENVLKMEPNFLQVPAPRRRPQPLGTPAAFSPLCPSFMTAPLMQVSQLRPQRMYSRPEQRPSS